MWGTNGTQARITTAQQARLAYVYVRQSSLGQVTQHRESTDLQYQLAQRAVELGWPPERVKIIDEDLGKSGASTTERQGFQHLMAEIGLGRVGLVLSFDASRLARNNGDWYQLLELCAVFSTLIADSERVYDANLYTDRLLLGLSGMMSEAELYQLKRRMQAGAWNKAQRGELHKALPVGLVRLRNGEVVLHPNQEVQARIRLVFEKFQELRNARAVFRYLKAADLMLPSRPLRGPAPHDVVWQAARASMVLAILKNPTYAGAYVYGQQTQDPARRKPGHPHSGIVRRPIDEWPIVIQNAHAGYISWETFLANQAQLAGNQSRYRDGRPGAAHQGQALLQGILRCGRCGARMRLRYSGPQGNFPVYECTYAQTEYGGPRCQEVRGLGLDAEIERLVLQALQPDQLALALAALDELEHEYAALKRQRELHLERLRYESERARRQYDAVEPENRLVARTLEQRWEESLRLLEKAQQEHETWVVQQHLELTSADQADILALGTDLPRVWHAPTTTAADRKQVVRFVIREVIVDQQRAQGKVWFQVNWQTGAVSEHRYTRRVRSYAEHAHSEQIQQRIRELHAAHKLDDEIATVLNAEGFRTTKRGLFDSKIIWLLRDRMGLAAAKPNGPHPVQWEADVYSVQGAAGAVGVLSGTIYKWLETGRIRGEQLRKGTPWKIFLTPAEITALKDHVRRVRRSRKEAS